MYRTRKTRLTSKASLYEGLVNDTGNEYVRTWNFTSMSAWIDYAEKGIPAKPSMRTSREYSPTYHGEANFETAANLARNGWPQGSQKIARLSNVLVDKIMTFIDAQTVQYDVTGNDFDVSMYLANVPEYWTTLETCDGQSN